MGQVPVRVVLTTFTEPTLSGRASTVMTKRTRDQNASPSAQ